MRRPIIVFLPLLAALAAGQQQQIDKLVPPWGEFQDFFGEAIALDGQRVLIGGRNATNGDAVDHAGVAHLYATNGLDWTLCGTLNAPDAGSSDQFGAAVALAGNWAAVGAPADSTTAFRSGSVYLFEQRSSGWTATDKISDPLEGRQSGFGTALAMQGDTLLIGQPAADTPGGAKRGAVHAYRRQGSEWVLEQVLFAPASQSIWGYFGASVALDGDVAAIGAFFDQGGEGAAFVFERAGGKWSLVKELHDPTPKKDDRYGQSVAVHGQVVVVGQDDPIAYPQPAGRAYVYRRGALGWQLEAELAAPDGHHSNHFGTSVAAADGYVMVGAIEQKTSAVVTGAVYVYRYAAGAWNLAARLVPSDIDDYVGLGRRLAADGHRLLVGSHYGEVNDVKMGAGYVYHLPIGDAGCAGEPNSAGAGATLSAQGSPRAGDRALRLESAGLPAGRSTTFMASKSPGSTPFFSGGQGTLCLGSPFGRLNADPIFSDASGRAVLDVRTDAISLGGALISIQPGETWYFQAFYDDDNPGPTTNLSASLVVLFE